MDTMQISTHGGEHTHLHTHILTMASVIQGSLQKRKQKHLGVRTTEVYQDAASPRGDCIKNTGTMPASWHMITWMEGNLIWSHTKTINYGKLMRAGSGRTDLSRRCVPLTGYPIHSGQS